MALSIKVYALLLLLVLTNSISSAESISNNVNSFPSLHKDVVWMKARKLLVVDAVVLDYDYAGHNPKHDPRKGKPKNP